MEKILIVVEKRIDKKDFEKTVHDRLTIVISTLGRGSFELKEINNTLASNAVRETHFSYELYADNPLFFFGAGMVLSEMITRYIIL